MSQNNDPGLNKLVKVCSDCLYKNEVAHRHCMQCGKSLAGVKVQLESSLTALLQELPVDETPTNTPAVGIPADQLPHTQQALPLSRAATSRSDQSTPVTPILVKPPVSAPLPGPAPHQVPSSGNSSGQKKSQRNWIVRLIMVVVALLAIAALLFALLPRFLGGNSSPKSSPMGLGEFKASNGELLGVNDGSSAPFLLGPGGQFKQQAVNQWKQGHPDQAIASWQSALHVIDEKKNIDTNNDAEASIYLENQLMSLSPLPYKTLVVGVDFVDSLGSSESDLQGVYVAQHEFNMANHGFHLRVLIANSGADPDNVSAVARQIVQIATQDKTVLGVVSWLTSSDNLLVLPILQKARVPMISPTASSDKLTGISPFFFRIAPPNSRQGRASALFAEQTLQAQTVVVFVDPHEPYSGNLAQDFEKQFRQDKRVILKEELFTSDKTTKIGSLIQDALALHPDLLYFTARDTNDQRNFEGALPTSGPFATIPALAGDSGYTIEKAGYGRWYFVSFAFPGELNNKLSNYEAQFPFYQDYSDDFNQDGLRQGGYYGYTRPNNEAMLSYDVTSVFIQAMLMSLNRQKIAVTSADLQHLTPVLLATTLPDVVLQGVSGWIAFNAGHDPIKKAFVFLGVSPDGHTYMKDWQGCFTQTLCRNAS